MTFRDYLTKGPQPVWIRYLLLIGLAFLLTRILLDSNFRQTALLYILVPYLVSVALYVWLAQPEGRSRGQRFWRHIRNAFIVMLATSALLFEGFICVLMFMPIYLIIAAISYALAPKEFPAKDQTDILKVSVVPVIIIALSLEGIHPALSFEREETVIRTKTVALSLDEIHDNLDDAIRLDAPRSPFLSIFPLPDRIEAGSLQTGDVHKAYFTYRRWGNGRVNVHKGETWLSLTEVSPQRIRTEITKDTSYFSHYLTLHGTQIDLNPVAEDQTEIILTIRYRRDLDPAWYFGPMQRQAMRESADYLIDHIIGKTQ